MQKKLLTLAVAGALGAPGLALAQASVEVYGTVNMSFGNVSYSGAPINAGNTQAVSSTSKWDVASHASNYGLRGRENLGGGLTAWFQIETNAPMERSANIAITPASRNSAVGVQGAFGNAFMGQWTTPWADLDALWAIGTVGGWGPVTSIIGRRETTGVAPNPFCANTIPVPAAGTTGANICDAVEAAGGVGHPFWRRVSNAVFYQSPVINGLQGKFAYQTNEGRAANGTGSAAFGSTANPSMWSASGQWSGMGGAARIGFAYDKHSEFSAAKKNDIGYAVKGGYDFGVFDLGLAFEKMTYQSPAVGGSECELVNTAVAVSFPIASGFIRGSWAKASDMNDAGCGPAGTAISPAGSFVGANGGTEVNFGYEHRFSKRTTIGIGYARIDNDALGTHSWTGLPPNSGGAANGPATGQDVSTFFLNMIHRF